MGPALARFLPFMISAKKQSTNGVSSQLNVMEAADVINCAVDAMILYLHDLFVIQKEPFPDVVNDYHSKW